MAKKSFLEEKYCELNHLKNLLQTYPKDYCETIIKVMNKVCDEISEYLEHEKKKIKKNIKKITREKFIPEEIEEMEYVEDMEYVEEVGGLANYTIEEISKFDGVNGGLAYVVINGLVYDVTQIQTWDEGKHYGISAGKDVTKCFEACHADDMELLKKLKVVGRIVEK